MRDKNSFAQFVRIRVGSKIAVFGSAAGSRWNSSQVKSGTDHWSHCWSIALGGGGIGGGQVVGASDEKGAYLAEGRKITIGDLFATVYKAFGIDWHKEYMHPIGRPVKIANSENDHTGEPVKQLI